MNQAHLQWCRDLFASLKEGGVWGIPRSGLVFTKRGNRFVLTGIAPTDAADQTGIEPPLTGTDLRRLQEADYEDIKRHFAAAGIEIQDEIGSDA